MRISKQIAQGHKYGWQARVFEPEDGTNALKSVIS
jgi:hypothetical protein